MGRLSVLVGVLVALLLAAGSAAAEPPARLDDRVTDRVGVLSSGAAAEVVAAIERLRAEDGVDLFVVFVESFDGAPGQDWADDTAVRSQLGEEDVLLAVAVRDRAYGLSVAEGFPIGESEIDEIRTGEVEPRLGANDWAGAVVALADGLRTGGGNGLSIGLVLGGVAVIGAGAYVLRRRRQRTRAASDATRSDATPPATETPDEFGDQSTEDLGYRASTALIEVDDAVRTSEQELAAARAHFGAEAVAEFDEALERSRADMLHAFALRQRLDDDQPEDEPARRALYGEIIRIAAAADDRLDDHVEAFDKLRGLETRAQGYVDELQARLDSVSARLPEVEAVWTALQARYAAGALEPVDGDLDQARELLAAAAAELGQARRELAGTGSRPGPAAGSADGSGRTTRPEELPDGGGPGGSDLDRTGPAPGTPGSSHRDGGLGSPAAPDGTGDGAAGTVGGAAAAVVDARAAEDATTQAELLLDGIVRRKSELADVADSIPAARAEVEQDLAEARAIGGDALAPVVARATAALSAAADAEGAPRPDPIAALRLLGDAGAALDMGIADARAAADRERRAAAALEQALLTARSTVAAAEDFVATRRGAVGAPARTRLAEARRHLQLAGGGDPVAALREAQHADALAQEALRLARADVTGWSQAGTAGSGVDLGSLILGGILSGASRGYRSGGFGSGGFGSGRTGGYRRSPGSFGGSSRRGRRGGGGRF